MHLCKKEELENKANGGKINEGKEKESFKKQFSWPFTFSAFHL